MEERICPRCLNKDPRYFYRGSRGVYCRRCIAFGIQMIEEDREPVPLSQANEDSAEYRIDFPLTKAQAEIARKTCELIDSADILLRCVCGAGKTEMTVPLIAQTLRRGQKICFAIARRQVVLEVGERLQKYFHEAKVVTVCGGHTEETDGDLIVCTTHQLYRYYQAFDVLILDEPDAFPFKGDPVLHGIARTSCRGHIVYLTATPDQELKKRIEEKSLVCLRLDSRPHGRPLPVPEIEIGSPFVLLIRLVKWVKAHAGHPRMIFAPSIAEAHRLCRFLRMFTKCSVCTSHSARRDAIIEHFRAHKHGVIVATTVLERGVTVKDADVLVWHADSGVFDEAGLVQMAGRAGRNFNNPYGDVLFLCYRKSDRVEECRNEIRECNHAVSSLR